MFFLAHSCYNSPHVLLKSCFSCDLRTFLQVDATALLGIVNIGPFVIVPSSLIIVDKTQCSATAPPVNPAPPSEAVSTSTCSIITDITANSQESGSFLLCYATDNCDGMTCNLGSYYTTDIQALACRDPPSFYVQVTRADVLVFNDILDKTTTVDLGSYGQLKVQIVDYGDEISIEVQYMYVRKCMYTLKLWTCVLLYSYLLMYINSSL